MASAADIVLGQPVQKPSIKEGVATKPSNAASVVLGKPVAAPKEEEIFEGGFAQDVFDVLQVPQFAATGALTPGVTIGEAVKKKVSPSKALNIDTSTIPGMTAALAVDILADPLNFIGVGMLTKGGVATTKAGKAAVTLGKAAQKGERALVTLDVPLVKALQGIPIVKGTPVFEALTKVGNKLENVPGISKLRDAFVSAPAVRKLDNIDEIESIKKTVSDIWQKSDEAKALQRVVEADILDFSQFLDKGLKSLVNAGKIVDEDIVMFARKLNDPAMTAEIPEVMMPLFNRAKAKTEELGITWRSLGGPTLQGKVTPNIPDRKSLEFLREQASSPVAAAKLSPKTGQDLSPKYFKLGDEPVVKQGNKAYGLETGQEFTSKGDNVYKAKSGESFQKAAVRPDEINPLFEKLGIKLRFVEDAPLQVLQLGKSVAKKKAATRFIESVKEFGTKVDGRIPEGMVESSVVKGYAFPAEAVQIIDATFSKFSNIESVNDFIKLYDKAQNTLKGVLTFINPAFHSRNVVSNNWQYFLAGGNFKHLPRALRIQKLVGKARRAGDSPVKFLKGKDKKFYNEFREQGLGGTGWFDSDVEKTLRGLERKFVFDIGGKAGSFLEDWAKLTLFIDRRTKGFPIEKAAKDVKKYLFDYSDLTDMERNVFKRIMPFYTWTRKNLPLQAAMLIQSPTKASSIDKVRKAIEQQMSGEKVDRELLPEWLKDGYPVFLGEDADGVQNFFNLSGFLPTVDLGQIANPQDTALSNISPLIKTPIEMLTNYDWYFQNQIRRYEGEKKEFLGLDLDPKVIKALKLIRPLGEFERIKKSVKEGDEVEALTKFLFGAKSTEVDPGRQEWFRNHDQFNTINLIERGLDKAKERGDANEVARLEELLQDARQGEGY